MEARADGIWGRVAWNAAGRALLADQAYRGISPVIIYDAAGVVVRIKNAGLVNYPNLHNLTALNQESSMTFRTQLAEKLGLKADATEADILGAFPITAETAADTALQASLGEIGSLVGMPQAEAIAIVAAVKARVAAKPAEPAEMLAMQTELTSVTSQLAVLQSQSMREKAEAFVDAAIAAARPGVKSRRAYYIARHMEDPLETAATVNAIPSFGPGRMMPAAQADAGMAGDLTALNAEQQGRALHVRAFAFQCEQKVRGLTVSMFDAITHVKKDIQL